MKKSWIFTRFPESVMGNLGVDLIHTPKVVCTPRAPDLRRAAVSLHPSCSRRDAGQRGADPLATRGASKGAAELGRRQLPVDGAATGSTAPFPLGQLH